MGMQTPTTNCNIRFNPAENNHRVPLPLFLTHSTIGGRSMRRLVFLNALPINALPDDRTIYLTITPIDAVILKNYINIADVVSYIRHPATVKLLNEKLGLKLEVSSGLYKYEEGDVLVVVSLKKPVRGQEVEDVSLSDLDVRLVLVSE